MLFFDNETPEGWPLVWLANSDKPSDDDEIADFCDCEGTPIEVVPADKKITISVWLNMQNQYKRSAEFWIEGGAVASAYILLAVEQYGLGACWVHIRNRMGQRKTSDEGIRELLGIPDAYSILNLIAIGEKGETKKAYTDSDLRTEKLHYEKF